MRIKENRYEDPRVEIIYFAETDIITASEETEPESSEEETTETPIPEAELEEIEDDVDYATGSEGQ